VVLQNKSFSTYRTGLCGTPPEVEGIKERKEGAIMTLIMQRSD